MGFVLDDYQDQLNLKEQGVQPVGEMVRLLDSMSETEAGLFRRMYKSGLFELMGTDGAFEFGLKLILLGMEHFALFRIPLMWRQL